MPGSVLSTENTETGACFQSPRHVQAVGRCEETPLIPVTTTAAGLGRGAEA